MLPIYTTTDKNLTLLQTNWSSQLNPLLINPLSNGIFLKKVSLASGTNTVNHLLSRKQQGWIVTDLDGPSSIYRSLPLNDKTLTLVSSTAVTVDIYVF